MRFNVRTEIFPFPFLVSLPIGEANLSFDAEKTAKANPFLATNLLAL